MRCARWCYGWQVSWGGCDRPHRQVLAVSHTTDHPVSHTVCCSHCPFLLKPGRNLLASQGEKSLPLLLPCRPCCNPVCTWAGWAEQLQCLCQPRPGQTTVECVLQAHKGGAGPGFLLLPHTQFPIPTAPQDAVSFSQARHFVPGNNIFCHVQRAPVCDAHPRVWSELSGGKIISF